MYLAIVNLRVATGKTTTAVYLADALARTGRTLLVDSDPRLSALSWAERSGRFGFQVLGLPTRDIHRRLPEMAPDFTHVVIDCPPGDLGIVASSVLAAERVVVPTSPSPDDLSALGPTLDLIRQIGTLSRTRVSILMSRVPDGSSGAGRDLSGIGAGELMAAQVPVLAGSGPPTVLEGSASAYGAVAEELLAAREPSGGAHRVRATVGARFSRSR